MSEPFIRPDVRAYLDRLAAQSLPPMSDQLIAMIRQMPPEAIPSPDLPVGDIAVALDLTMPSPAGEIALRLFDPRADRGPGPVVVFYHGGGFVACSIHTHAALTAEIARGLDLPVVSVEYRLAPEHKWPAASDDAEAAARWVASAAGQAALGLTFTHLVLCGDSAGGTLTSVTALALRDRPADLPVVLQIPIYPKADSSKVYPSMMQFKDGYGLPREDMEYFDRAMQADLSHWRQSPAVADQTGVAPALVVTAGLDPLRDEGRAYAAKLAEAGVEVTFREYAGTIHGFATYRAGIPSAREDLADILAEARTLLGRAVRA